MEKLKELFSRCKSTVELHYNPHRSYHDTIEQYIGDDIGDVEKEVLEEMKRTDTLIRLQFYPHSSVGFFLIFHYDIDKALDKALSLLNE